MEVFRFAFICTERAYKMEKDSPLENLFLLCGNGCPRFKVCEPMTLVREYPAQWVSPEINLHELANLRWNQGWGKGRLARHFGRSKTYIYDRLRLIEQGQGAGIGS